jgi:putative membrane protein
VGVKEDRMRRTGLLWVAAIVIAGGCSKTESTRAPVTQQPAGSTAAVGTSGNAPNVKGEGDFVQDVAVMNMAEVELSRMALEKAASPDIKSFAQRVIDDHGAAGTKLKGVVSGQPIEWPAQLDDKHRKIADELAKEQGGDFDRDYMKAMVYGHQDLAAKLESRLDLQSLADWKTAAAARTQSPALPEPKVALNDVTIRPDKSDSELTMKINQWAAETYPVTQKHLDTARTLRKATEKPSTN